MYQFQGYVWFVFEDEALGLSLSFVLGWLFLG